MVVAAGASFLFALFSFRCLTSKCSFCYFFEGLIRLRDIQIGCLKILSEKEEGGMVEGQEIKLVLFMFNSMEK